MSNFWGPPHRSASCFCVANIHSTDQVTIERVDVIDNLVDEDFARKVAHYLMDMHNRSIVIKLPDADRLFGQLTSELISASTLSTSLRLKASYAVSSANFPVAVILALSRN